MIVAVITIKHAQYAYVFQRTLQQRTHNNSNKTTQTREGGSQWLAASEAEQGSSCQFKKPEGEVKMTVIKIKEFFPFFPY